MVVKQPVVLVLAGVLLHHAEVHDEAVTVFHGAGCHPRTKAHVSPLLAISVSSGLPGRVAKASSSSVE